MVKNVALVDNVLQGKMWTSNQGGSGFGKFKDLPTPQTIAWESNNNFDLYIGSHNGFQSIGVEYTRQVIYLRDDFWIVKDNFQAPEPHIYKQVWQGHYTTENQPDLLRSSFDDATGCDILQLVPTDSVTKSGARGKEWSVVSKDEPNNFSFVTIIYPYLGYNNRINEEDTKSELKGWKQNNSLWFPENQNCISLTKQDESFFFGAKELTLKDNKIQTQAPSDLYIKMDKDSITIQNIGDTIVHLSLQTNNEAQNKKAFRQQDIAPGEIMTTEI